MSTHTTHPAPTVYAPSRPVQPHAVPSHQSGATVAATVAGAALLLAAIGFITVFSLLAASFGYPDVLDHPASDVLPRLLALGAAGRATWAMYAMIPLLLVPAAAGLATLHDTPAQRTTVRIASALAVLAGVCMTVGLVRWPSLQWELAHAWDTASNDQRAVLSVVFDGANAMLGNWIGEFLGELLLSMSFLLFGAVAWRDRQLPRWAAAFGMVAGVSGLLAMWRNVTPMVGAVAEVNNLVLPVWLVVWGVALLRVGVVRRAARAVHQPAR